MPGLNRWAWSQTCSVGSFPGRCRASEACALAEKRPVQGPVDLAQWGRSTIDAVPLAQNLCESGDLSYERKPAMAVFEWCRC